MLPFNLTVNKAIVCGEQLKGLSRSKVDTLSEGVEILRLLSFSN